MSRYAALLSNEFDEDGSSSSSSSSSSRNNKCHNGEQNAYPYQGGLEDLSSMRRDEEMVLESIYQQDFSCTGKRRYEIKIKPPDLSPKDIGASVTLSVKLVKGYPFVPPVVKFLNVVGLRDGELEILKKEVTKRAEECASQGQEMLYEIVIKIEEILLECNRSPQQQVMSAWEQMKQRENDKIANEESSTHLDRSSSEEEGEKEEQLEEQFVPIDSSGIENEYQRQINAMTAVRNKQKICVHGNVNDGIPVGVDDIGRLSSSSSNVDDSFEWDDEEDENTDFLKSATGSRYKIDFELLGILGKGGGGEVVKCRNRLDRRIYAVKKILLRPETGKSHAKFAEKLNRKLLREVTSISRMTHKNIVRYYQAWVEGESFVKESDSESEVISEDPTTAEYESSSQSEWWKKKVSGDESDEHKSNVGKIDDFADMLRFGTPNNVLQNPLFTGYEGLNLSKPKNNFALYSSDKSEVVDYSTSAQLDKSENEGVQKCLYIQMEYCSTTLRHLIDEGSLHPKPNESWRLARQIIEALSYVHSHKMIHRDLKPSNIFLDSENNVRIGDFGLATSSRGVRLAETDSEDVLNPQTSPVPDQKKYDMDINTFSHPTESMTKGVGTTFYRAPEQNVGSSYNEKVDIFSLGVVLFEMFHRPIETYMERAQILSTLRGDDLSLDSDLSFEIDDPHSSNKWEDLAIKRFPESFPSVSKAVNKLILWCLCRDPSKRPSANDLLSCSILPGKMELEKHYLDEALKILSNPQSLTYSQILSSLFDQLQPYHVEVTFESDVSIKAREHMRSGLDIKKSLVRILNNLGGARWGDIERDIDYLCTSSPLSIAAIHASLSRAIGMERFGKGLEYGTLQRATSTLAMCSSLPSIMGIADNLGSLPHVSESIKASLRTIFKSHAAVELESPLLSPSKRGSRVLHTFPGPLAKPSELMNKRGNILQLPQDLTANFARAVARGGMAASRLKRYEIGKVYQESLCDGHPKESVEAAFDIIYHDRFIKNGSFIEAELIQVLCQSLKNLASSEDFDLHPQPDPENNKLQRWHLRVTHTRIGDTIFDLCGLSQKDVKTRRDVLKVFSKCIAPLSMEHKTNEHVIAAMMNARDQHNIEDGCLKKLITFLECLQVKSIRPGDVVNSLDILQETVGDFRKAIDPELEKGSKQAKIYESCYRAIRGLRKFLHALEENTLFSCESLNDDAESGSSNLYDCPDYIIFDFFEQRQRHFHGGLYFQAFFTTISDDSLEEKANNLVQRKRAKLFAEGGRFDDLVRRYRPPGNFGSSISNLYTTAPIPIAAGIRFSVHRIVDRLYEVCQYKKFLLDDNISDMDDIRCMLGHPLQQINDISCMVASPNGFDSSSVQARAEVCSFLWAGGINAEYLPHQAAFSSLLRIEADEFSSDWTLEQIYHVCFLLRIPFLVIVAPHFLREKRSVRIRQIYDEMQGFKVLGGHEEFVTLSKLAQTVKEKLELRHKRSRPVDRTHSVSSR